jgi:YegS/Rv2252/BmrU family lipid kinase
LCYAYPVRPYFIVNPVSANGQTAKRWPAIKALFEARLEKLDFSLTKRRNHATCLTREALHNGFDRIIAVGGDGTLNEVINGFFDYNQKINPQATIGYYPSGTGEDFSLSLGIKKLSPQGHVDHLLDGKIKVIDIGQAVFHQENSKTAIRNFINESSLGFGAIVAKLSNQSSKALGGKTTFILIVLRCLFSLRAYKMRIMVDNLDFFNGRALIATISNGRYFGGSMMIAPMAKIDDRQLEVVVVGQMGRLEVIANLPSIYKGKHLANPKIKHFYGKEIVITADEPIGIEMDGEAVGITSASFKIIDSLQFVL